MNKMLSVNASRRFDQQQLLESLRNYDPWGRAGGGAPTGDVRRRDLLSRYIYPQNQNMWKDIREQPLPGLRPRQRPRKTFLTTDLTRPREALTEPPDITKYDPVECQKQDDVARKFPHVWSSEPWDSRGPWGGCGPGGRPWRPAGHVGRNFHHSMGWTTGNTFHFPNIDNKENATYRHHKKGVKITESKLEPINDGRSKMPPITTNHRSSTGYDRGIDRLEYLQRNDNIRNDYNHQGHHHRAGGTPTRQLLQMTGGIELVPLMRARAWTFRQAIPHENFSSQFASHMQKKIKAHK